MPANMFMDDETLASMEAKLGISSSETDAPEPDTQGASKDVETSPDTDSSTTKPESDPDKEDPADVGVTDVKEPPVKGWVPRQRLNDESAKRQAMADELKELRLFKTSHGAQQQQTLVQPTLESKTGNVEALINELWPDGDVSDTSKLIAERMQAQEDRLNAMERSVETREIKQLQDSWTTEIKETNAYFKKEHGFEIPINLINDGIIASQGNKSPHEVMEGILEWQLGLTKKEAKEVVADAKEATPATPATSRKGKGKRSLSQSSKERKIPDTIEEASTLAAAALGVDW